MFTKTMTLALGAALIGTTALAAETPVKEIDVEADLAAIENPAAAAHFATLETDLEGRIAELLTPENLVGADAEGVKISVDIDELELASTWANQADFAESKIAALVNVSSEDDHSKFDNYTLSVAYPDVLVFLPEGADASSLTMDSDIYYEAMLTAVADHIVTHLK
ncbi:hypothetical protein [Pseudothioclava nitratireducens]|jgi:hypothetical protein|uniref:hypothetical protein n=1 Tax=Pseudothioclava nitratireducens TaxID=1928646 RepID=UPI0023DA350D|nr:hypothetical protein [Defluviimonas nitratireducens]MDF1619920.1 hypothetical protein [Defluviimonas nitratireducens]